MSAKKLPDDTYEGALAEQDAPYMSVVPGRAATDRRLSAFQYRVFSLMCGYANRQTRICWPKQETLARLLGTNVQVISKIVAQLIKLGYVEVAKSGFPARNVYRIIFDDPKPKPLAECLPATELSPQTSQSCLPRQVRVVSPDKCNNRLLEQTIRTSSSNVEVNQHSLARSAENVPDETTAPPERRTREGLNTAALKRDELFLALAACLGREPLTQREWWQWRTAVNNLHSAQATAADIPRAIRGFQAAFPRAKVTPLGLVNNWSLIREGKAHDLAQLEIAQRAATAAEAERRERERITAGDRETQRDEARRLLIELGYADDTGNITRG